MGAKFKNLYETLGIQSTASAQEIERAYQKLAAKFHPDQNCGDTYYSDWFNKIKAAYEILMDPKRRMEYDRKYTEVAQALNRTPRTMFWPTKERAHSYSGDIPFLFDDGIRKDEHNFHATLQKINDFIPAYLIAKQGYRQVEGNYIKQLNKLNALKQFKWFHLLAICLMVIGASIMWLLI